MQVLSYRENWVRNKTPSRSILLRHGLPIIHYNSTVLLLWIVFYQLTEKFAELSLSRRNESSSSAFPRDMTSTISLRIFRTSKTARNDASRKDLFIRFDSRILSRIPRAVSNVLCVAKPMVSDSSFMCRWYLSPVFALGLVVAMLILLVLCFPLLTALQNLHPNRLEETMMVGGTIQE